MDSATCPSVIAGPTGPAKREEEDTTARKPAAVGQMEASRRQAGPHQNATSSFTATTQAGGETGKPQLTLGPCPFGQAGTPATQGLPQAQAYNTGGPEGI